VGGSMKRVRVVLSLKNMKKNKEWWKQKDKNGTRLILP
jgi:hypothetical protein